MDQNILATEFKGSKRAYFVATCSQSPWATASCVRKIAQAKHFDNYGFNSVVMPQGYLTGGGTKPRSENDRILADAEPKIQTIAAFIKAGEKLPEEKPGNAMMSTMVNPIMYKMMMSAKQFRVSDKCIHCGSCAERCPLNNIKMVEGKPVWVVHNPVLL